MTAIYLKCGNKREVRIGPDHRLSGQVCFICGGRLGIARWVPGRIAGSFTVNSYKTELRSFKDRAILAANQARRARQKEKREARLAKKVKRIRGAAVPV